MSTTKRKLKRLRERAMATPPQRVEVCASFARKFSLQNYGGPQYESIDFFVSRKLDCPVDSVGWVTESLRQACIEEVEMAARDYLVSARAAGWKSQVPKPHPVAQANARAFEQHQLAKGGAK
jgi:hypothetical protein